MKKILFLLLLFPSLSYADRLGGINSNTDVLLASSATATYIQMSSRTAGSIPFVNSGLDLGQNNSSLFWDQTNNRLGIGTTTPGVSLDVMGAAPIARVKATTVGGDGVFKIDNVSNNDRAFLELDTTGVRRWVMGALGSTTKLSFSTSFVAGLDVFALNISPLTLNTGTGALATISGTWSQTGSASSVDLLINRTETSIGSGTQRLIDAQVGGTTAFNVDTAGIVRSTGGFISTANSFLAAINNTSTANNSRIQLTATGTIINRNVADANQCLIVNQVNASSTGKILDLQDASSSKLSVSTTGKVDAYQGTATAGYGLPAIYGAGRSVAQAGAVASVAAFTVGAVDGSFIVSSNVLVTASTTHSFTVTCAYTDEGNTARTLTLNFSNLAGTISPTIANAGGAVPYLGIPSHIRCKGGTTITIATTGTFTTVTYNVEGIITQVN